MIPFGLSSLMTVSGPIPRRLAKCLKAGSVGLHLLTAVPNPGVVAASGYATIPTTAGNWYVKTAGRFYCSNDQRSRVRQAGTVTGVQLYIDTLTHVAQIWVGIYRLGKSWTLIGGEDITAKLTAGQINTVTLDTPIPVQVGDYVAYGGLADATDTIACFTAITGAPDAATYYGTMLAPSSTMNWAAWTPIAAWLPIRVLMAPPVLVGIGTSITMGAPGNTSFITGTDHEWTPASQYFTYLPAGCTYQNMGIGSDTSTQIAARFAADVVALKPKVCIIECGINDIAGGTITQATFLANMTAMLDLCRTNGIIPVFVRLPWTNGTDEQNTTYDAWGEALKPILKGYPHGTYVDARYALGTGANLWDIKAAYNADGVHYNADGYAALAQAILDAPLGA